MRRPEPQDVPERAKARSLAQAGGEAFDGMAMAEEAVGKTGGGEREKGSLSRSFRSRRDCRGASSPGCSGLGEAEEIQRAGRKGSDAVLCRAGEPDTENSAVGRKRRRAAPGKRKVGRADMGGARRARGREKLPSGRDGSGRHVVQDVPGRAAAQAEEQLQAAPPENCLQRVRRATLRTVRLA